MKTIHERLTESIEDDDAIDDPHCVELDRLAQHVAKCLIDEIVSMGIDDSALLLTISERLHEECLILTYHNQDLITDHLEGWATDFVNGPKLEYLSESVH